MSFPLSLMLNQVNFCEICYSLNVHIMDMYNNMDTLRFQPNYLFCLSCIDVSIPVKCKQLRATRSKTTDVPGPSGTTGKWRNIHAH